VTNNKLALGGTGVITRTFKSVDACNNVATHSQVITVVDTTKPTFTSVPASITISCTQINNVAPAQTGGSAVATDGCSVATVAYSDVTVASPSCPASGTITRTWTATDACGNVISATQSIVFQDIVKPQQTSVTPSITMEFSGSENTSPSATGTVTATDNCDPAVSTTFADTRTAGSCSPAYQIVRVWTSSDHCGNSITSQQTIAVRDTTAPVLTVPVNIIVDPKSSTDPSVTGQATATDASGQVTITFSDVKQYIAPPDKKKYIITRTWTAKDACGNTATGAQTITVMHTKPPKCTPSNPDELCLWPANLNYQCFNLVASSSSFITALSDDPDAVITRTLTSCTVSETSSGACVVYNNALCVRAQRNSIANDRRYTVSFTVSDDRGNSVAFSQQIVVPATQDGHPGCLWPNTSGWGSRRLLGETSAEQSAIVDFTEVDDVPAELPEELLPLEAEPLDDMEESAPRGSFWRLW